MVWINYLQLERWANIRYSNSLPQGLPNGRSYETWMIGSIAEDELKNNNLSKENWNCEIVNDNELKFHDDFIPMPPFKNFPKSGFSQTIVNSNDSPELYIVGDMVYSEELDTELITNYFYKYEFNTGQWSDLSEKTKSILRPRAFHKVIEADNSLLLFGGIQNDEAIKRKFEHTAPINDDADIGDITTIYKFNLNEQKWSTVNAKLNKDPNIYKTGQVSGSVYDVYKGKIISYISLFNYVKNIYQHQLGILDYKTWEWEWHSIKNEVGTDNNLFLSFYQTLIINHQLILIHGISNQSQDKKLYVINLETYKFQGFLNISGEYSKSQASGLPSWAVTISTLGSILLVILLITTTWFYLRYKKQVKVNDNNSEQEMQEVWASADHENDGLKSRAATFSNSSKRSTGGLNGSTLIDGSMINYECFQHEVDLEGLEIVKAKTFR
ncbi:hypothetical protein CONCODRAFT_13873 [Conidiobolus coronatus NRRL 28638]|uniref:Galactose oxidase n=1 Tax=Conidiobolus coronatus (strain ATCC 28846 / CBS 209.66 / NRRL 28638) TaxID=796925 RepID=A0A137NQ02_CONC2|nr:hypothetical protein CONCODRAFT_13873 [Conidiobolus coronatus NRRL 28638]|eukprot:KXN64822.1 hypothetical protein CONCODRAFT_13873 [Conidiobolus coronatus NRRL 28638]